MSTVDKSAPVCAAASKGSRTSETLSTPMPPELLGDLGLPEAQVEAEDDRGALLERQPGQGVVQRGVDLGDVLGTQQAPGPAGDRGASQQGHGTG
jgi:hypothetical protein